MEAASWTRNNQRGTLAADGRYRILSGLSDSNGWAVGRTWSARSGPVCLTAGPPRLLAAVRLTDGMPFYVWGQSRRGRLLRLGPKNRTVAEFCWRHLGRQSDRVAGKTVGCPRVVP
jgi:hypothetical protein